MSPATVTSPSFRSLRRRRPWLAGVSAVAITALLAGCGSNSSGTTASSAKGSSAGLGNLKVITATPDTLAFIGAEAGPQLNAWKGTGITVSFVSGTPSTVTTALASGSADIGVTAGSEAALANAKGVKTKLAACIMPDWLQNVIVSKKSGITSIAGLEGKTIGISSFGSPSGYATSVLAAHEHWSSGDYKTVPLGSLQGLEAGLQSGAIDGFVWGVDVADELQTQGIARNLGSVESMVGPNCFEAIQVSDAVIAQRPQAVAAFFDGYFKDVAYLKKDPSVARKILVSDWHFPASSVNDYLSTELNALSSTGAMTSAELAGLVKATQFIAPGSSAASIRDGYLYWKKIK